MRARFPFSILLLVGVLACAKSTGSVGPSASASAPFVSPSSAPSSADAASDAASPSAVECADAAPLAAYTGNDWPSLAALTDTGNAVRDALAARDVRRFAGFVHPTRGVRFSPYAYVDTKADVVLRRSDIEPAFASSKTRTWGAFDGSGEPIVLTFRAYLARFVAFSELAQLAPRLNGSVAVGNTVNNQRDVYGSAPYVEYYSAGKNGGTDWEALRVVFEPVNGKLFVVGVIHDVWTI